jgi:predicted phosphodiesterase
VDSRADDIISKGVVMRNSCCSGRDSQNWVIKRRVFLKLTAAFLLCLAVLLSFCVPACPPIGRFGTVRFGIVTDCHYADANTAENRFYRESLAKLAECVALLSAQKVDFLIEIGDFKDQGQPPVEQKSLSYLQAVEKVFQGFDGPTYHVLGNHDMDSISKKQFLSRVENTNINSDRSYYSFELKGLHCVVLDAGYKSDGTDYDHGNFDWKDSSVSSEELAWLKQDLAAAHGRVVVFIHQLLDGTGSFYIKNAPDVRQILQESGKVLAVFQGHLHSGQYSSIEGIHYYTLKAVIEGSGPENNSYAIVEVHPDGSITVTGYRKAVSRTENSTGTSNVEQ